MMELISYPPVSTGVRVDAPATAVHPGGIQTELGRYAYAEPGDLQKRVDQINAERSRAPHAGEGADAATPPRGK